MRAHTHLIHGLECLPEGTLPKSWLRKIRFPQQVRVAENKLYWGVRIFAMESAIFVLFCMLGYV